LRSPPFQPWQLAHRFRVGELLCEQVVHAQDSSGIVADVTLTDDFLDWTTVALDGCFVDVLVDFCALCCLAFISS
jgi:hypothetical protein